MDKLFDHIEVLEGGELCRCGGEIDKRTQLETNIWYSKCFRCGKEYNVIYMEGMPIE